MPPATPQRHKIRVIEMRFMRPNELRGHDGNFRTHPQFQRHVMADALDEVGIAGALMAYYSERNGGALTLIDGHLRQEEFGDEDWPVIITDLNDAEADKQLLRHDAISALAGQDRAKLDLALHRDTSTKEATLKLFAKMAADAGLYTDAPPAAEPDDEDGGGLDFAGAGTPDAPDADVDAPTSDAPLVKIQPLFLNTDNFQTFIDRCHALGEHFATANLTDTVVEAVARLSVLLDAGELD